MTRKMAGEVDWKVLYRGCSEEARQGDSRGVSDVYLTSPEGHDIVDERRRQEKCRRDCLWYDVDFSQSRETI